MTKEARNPEAQKDRIHTIRDIIIDLQNGSQENFGPREQFFHGKLVPR